MTRLSLLVIAVASVLAIPATPAGATQVTHIKDSFTFSNTFKAGTFCTAPIRGYGTIFENIIVLGDPTNPTRIINHSHEFNFTENLSTGQVLTDTDRFTIFFNPLADTLSFRGSTFHLKDSQGTGPTIAVGAGLFTFALDTGEAIKFTPHAVPDQVALICPLLGSSPA